MQKTNYTHCSYRPIRFLFYSHILLWESLIGCHEKNSFPLNHCDKVKVRSFVFTSFSQNTPPSQPQDESGWGDYRRKGGDYNTSLFFSWLWRLCSHHHGYRLLLPSFRTLTETFPHWIPELCAHCSAQLRCVRRAGNAERRGRFLLVGATKKEPTWGIPIIQAN